MEQLVQAKLAKVQEMKKWLKRAGEVIDSQKKIVEGARLKQQQNVYEVTLVRVRGRVIWVGLGKELGLGLGLGLG